MTEAVKDRRRAGRSRDAPHEGFIQPEKIDETLQGFTGTHPLGRGGTARDVASAITYLFSDDASWVMSAVLDVDGGLMAGRNSEDTD